MRFIDTHCHLDFSEFDADRDTIIQQSQKIGVKAFIVPAVSASNWVSTLALSKQYQSIKCALGIHPLFLGSSLERDLEKLEALIQSNRQHVVAIGEIGLDYWDKRADRDYQQSVFEKQVEIAKRLELPVLIHARKSHDEVLSIIKKQRLENGGIIHCFSGSESHARRYIENSFKLGIGGVITYDNAKRIHHVAEILELGVFVLETDSPDIPIQSDKGRRNSPLAIPDIFAAFARWRRESPELVAERIFRTTLEIFPQLIEVTRE